MNYKTTRPYKRLSKDRQHAANAAGEVKVEVLITSKGGTTTETGTSFASSLTNKKALANATERAKQDALAKHISAVSADIKGLKKGVQLQYDGASGKLKVKDYGVKRVVIIKRWYRYRIPRNERIKRENWNNGSWIVRRRRDGTFINRVRADNDNRADTGLGDFSEDYVDYFDDV